MDTSRTKIKPPQYIISWIILSFKSPCLTGFDYSLSLIIFFVSYLFCSAYQFSMVKDLSFISHLVAYVVFLLWIFNVKYLSFISFNLVCLDWPTHCYTQKLDTWRWWTRLLYSPSCLSSSFFFVHKWGKYYLKFIQRHNNRVAIHLSDRASYKWTPVL